MKIIDSYARHYAVVETDRGTFRVYPQGQVDWATDYPATSPADIYTAEEIEMIRACGLAMMGF